MTQRPPNGPTLRDHRALDNAPGTAALNARLDAIRARNEASQFSHAVLRDEPMSDTPKDLLEWLQTTRRGVAPLTMDDQYGEPTRHLWVVDGADASCIMPTVWEAIERAREKLGDEPPSEDYVWPDGQVRPEEPYRCGCFISGLGWQCTKLSDHEGDHEFPSFLPLPSEAPK